MFKRTASSFAAVLALTMFASVLPAHAAVSGSNSTSQAVGGANPLPQAVGGANPLPQAVGGANPLPQAVGGANPLPQAVVWMLAVRSMFGL